MKIERTRNAARNILYGSLLKICQTAAPFLMRTAMIHFMGVKYLGLSGLFASILQALNLAELGVGSAMVYSMYQPIIEDDTDLLCALMRLYRTYYRVIGLVIAGIGILSAPFMNHLIRGEIPSDINITALYLLNLGTTVLTYWLFGYKNCLLDAHQRVDISSKIILAVSFIQYGIQFFIVCTSGSFYTYMLVTFLSNIAINVITAAAVSKMFPGYKPVGRVDKKTRKKINRRILDLFTTKIENMIVNSADTIVISASLGLTILAVYQNYYSIITAITGLVAIIFQACLAGIGNSVIVETKEKNLADLNKFTFIILWIAGFCVCSLLCLYQPLMKLWVGEEFMLETPAVVCLCVYYFIFEIIQLLNTYKDAAGIWHKDRFRPLVTACVNLILNGITVRFWGIYGIILSTVLSILLVGLPWLLHNIFTVLFQKEQLLSYVRKLLYYMVIVIVSCVVCAFFCQFIERSDLETLVIRGVICCIVPNAIYFMAYRRKKEFKQCLKLVEKIVKREKA